MENQRITYCPPQHPATDFPLVDVVIVHSRGDLGGWYKLALKSAATQTWPNTGILVVDNNDRALSIGAAWNLAVKASTAKYLLFLGDDDYMSMDLVAHLAGCMERLREEPEGRHLVLFTSYCTMIDENNQPIERAERMPNGVHSVTMVQLHHTGMYLRTWLEEHPFNESLAKHVSTDMQQRIAQRGQIINARTYHASGYHYGYMYRNHIGMASGAKVVRKMGIA